MKAWVYAGAGLAVVIGLALGVTLRPHAAVDEAGDAPQPAAVAGLAAPPAPPSDESRAIARYGDRLPDYVLGTDLRKLAKAAALSPSLPIPQDPQNYYVSPLGRPPAATDAGIDASAMVDGQPVVLPVASNDDEATPEAAGDTRVEQR